MFFNYKIILESYNQRHPNRYGSRNPNDPGPGSFNKSVLVILAEGLAWLNDKLKFCTPLAGVADVVKFKGFLSDLWTNLVMMDYPYPTSFLSPLPGNPVQVAKISSTVFLLYPFI